MLCLRNDIIEVQFNEQNGAIRKMIDRKKGKVIIDNLLDEVFKLELEEEVYSEDFEAFSYTGEDDKLQLCWRLPGELKLIALWQLCEDSVIMESHVENYGRWKVSSIEYPLLDGIGDLAKAYGAQEGEAKNCIAHSYATGLLVENPLEHFKEEEGFRYMPYPESFSGATMQFFTYYCENTAGLYFAAYDNQYHQKWLNIYKHGGSLRVSQIYGYEDIEAGKGLMAPWKFVITLTKGDGWYEAGDLYKEWAVRQSWCSRGRLCERTGDNKAAWLYEDMGACTFGLNACHDRTAWINRYARDIKSPIFHILGPDWPNVEQNYMNSLPGGYNDWFPTRFSKENRNAIRENGDRFAPFEFDFLVAIDKSDSDQICESLQKWPQKPKSKDEYKFTMLCPACEYTRKLHVTRDVQVVKESGCDAMYYDISANNILKTCMSDEHGHPVGAGKEMTKAYREIYLETRNKLSAEKGHYVPLGTEMINEVFLDCLDFYQARANAQPCSSLETWIFRDLIKQGTAQLIPMFQYVYSGYAPLRMDGWGKLTQEGGDLIYHTIAKTYLWGGLFEINSEYSEMEVLEEKGNRAKEHYSDFKAAGFRYDKKIADYIAKFAALRTGSHKEILAYGEMKRPPRLRNAKVWRTYFQYNSSKRSLELGDRGTILLDSVIASRYRYRNSELILIANTSEFHQEMIWEDYCLEDDKEYDVCLDYVDEDSCFINILGRELNGIKLMPKQLVLIKINNK